MAEHTPDCLPPCDCGYISARKAEIAEELKKYSGLMYWIMYEDLYMSEVSKAFMRGVERHLIEKYGTNWRDRFPPGQNITETLRFDK